jgi:hypothetical protein
MTIFILVFFNDETVNAGTAANTSLEILTDLLDESTIKGAKRNATGGWSAPRLLERNIFEFELKPHSYRVFKLN